MKVYGVNKMNFEKTWQRKHSKRWETVKVPFDEVKYVLTLEIIRESVRRNT